MEEKRCVRRRWLTTTLGVWATVFAVSAAWGTPAQAVVVVTETPVNDLEPAVINGVGDPRSFQFAAYIPPGGKLEPLGPVRGDGTFASAVLVKDARGAMVGAYEAPYARDANGTLLPARYRIAGGSLVQTVEVKQGTAFPVLVDLADFEPVREGGGIEPPSHHISIPSNYVYDERRGSLHDYCHLSPDWWRPLGARNADFRGPCARHDMCYEARGRNKRNCDNDFRGNLVHECDYTYGRFNPLRYSCRGAAQQYYIGVVLGGNDPP